MRVFNNKQTNAIFILPLFFVTVFVATNTMPLSASALSVPELLQGLTAPLRSLTGTQDRQSISPASRQTERESQQATKSVTEPQQIAQPTKQAPATQNNPAVVSTVAPPQTAPGTIAATDTSVASAQLLNVQAVKSVKPTYYESSRLGMDQRNDLLYASIAGIGLAAIIYASSYGRVLWRLFYGDSSTPARRRITQ